MTGPLDHNRWDTLTTAGSSPNVSVIVLHYRQEADLDRLLGALERQTLAPAEVIVTDDGSGATPPLRFAGGPVRWITQPDRGFRAARARNRGAALAAADVLVFLDADGLPEPRTLEELTRHVAAHPDVLAVGRRRHADLTRLPRGGDPGGAPRLAEPAWLADGYRDSANLLAADGRSFRYVLSAVLACRSSLFADLVGFDERYEGYGGEDWDLGYRAFNNGAVLVHEPDAVVWHNGPEPGARTGIDGVRTRQAVRLATLVPEPLTRGAALPHALPDVLVDAVVGSAAGSADGAQVRLLHSLVRQTHRDLAVRVEGQLDPGVADLYAGWLRSGWSPDQERRARARIRVTAPLPADAVADLVARATADDLGRIDVVSDGHPVATLLTTRLLGRRRRWAGRCDPSLVEASLGMATVEVGAMPAGPANLEDWLASGPPHASGDG